MTDRLEEIEANPFIFEGCDCSECQERQWLIAEVKQQRATVDALKTAIDHMGADVVGVGTDGSILLRARLATPGTGKSLTLEMEE